MFLGALIMAPLAAWVMKQLDKLWDGKIKPGFEMLVNNFSAGIAAAVLAVLGFFAFGPVIEAISQGLGNGVNWLVAHSLLPLASLIIEPAKVLFLNNAINHGVLTPLGHHPGRASTGKSILFLLEANPGPGLGVLLAYSFFGTGLAKSHRARRRVIQFFGGIHEIYFPYVLAKPKLLLGTIAGGMVGIFTLVVFGAGLRAPAAPGSIIAVLAQTPGGSFVGVILSVLLAATTSFLICSLLLRLDRNKDSRPGRGDRRDGGAEGQARARSPACLSPEEEAVEDAAGGGRRAPRGRTRPLRGKPIHHIVFACDAGMGSSAMGASVLRNKIKKAGFADVDVHERGDREPDRRRRPDRDAPGPDPPGADDVARRPSTSRSTTS